jgi:hypothetical protein
MVLICQLSLHNISGGLILPLGTNFHIVGVAALFARIWGKFEINLVLKWGFISSPVEFIYYTCAFFCYWEGIRWEVDRRSIEEGAEKLQEWRAGLILWLDWPR